MKDSKRMARAIAGLLCAGCAIPDAHAQTTGMTPPQGVATNMIEEIVVTAEKRSENIQNVPIAVTALTSKMLVQAGVDDTRALELAVPALQYGSSSGFATPFLRGIGSDIQIPGAEASVATFIDGVYVASSQGTIFNLLGTDRVEVLAGPQGTLYGRNASGGAINIYTLTPSQKLEATATASYGNLNHFEGSGHVSGGVTDTLAVGLYVGASYRNSIYDFVPTRSPGQPTDVKNWGFRLKGVWRPTDAVKLTGSFERTTTLSGDEGFRNIQPDALGYLFGAPHIIENFKINANTPQFLRQYISTGILREEIDLGFANLVGVSGYRKSVAKVQDDADATSAPLITLGAPIPSEQKSQELQLISPDGSKVSWIAGLYYFDEHSGYLPLYVSSPIIFQPAPFDSLVQSLPESTKSYAVFAQAKFPLEFIATGFDVTVGGRYTWDKKYKSPSTQYFRAGGAGGTDVFPPVNFPGASAKWSKFTPKGTLSYEWSHELAYLTYAEGYKSGEYNISSATDTTPVAPENLKDYEVGLKSELFNRRLRINLAAYYYQFKNLQVQVLDPTNGISAVLRNAANAKAYGFELTGAVSVTDELRLNAALAAEHTEYTSFPNAPAFKFGATGNAQILGVSASGNPLVRAPKFVATLGPDYKVALPNGGAIEINSSIYYNSGYVFIASGQLRQPSYALVNASLAYVFPGEHWTATLYGNNLADKHHFGDMAATSTGTYVRDDLPRMYGVAFNWRL